MSRVRGRWPAYTVALMSSHQTFSGLNAAKLILFKILRADSCTQLRFVEWVVVEVLL